MPNIIPINLDHPGAATNYFNHVANTAIDFPLVTAAAKNSAA